ncbi:MAG: sel1 repeat family protein [Pseudomonadota bacterium]|nr:sel1 repeat family protein [Pseudomonadota bacterium]
MQKDETFEKLHEFLEANRSLLSAVDNKSNLGIATTVTELWQIVFRSPFTLHLKLMSADYLGNEKDLSNNPNHWYWMSRRLEGLTLFKQYLVSVLPSEDALSRCHPANNSNTWLGLTGTNEQATVIQHLIAKGVWPTSAALSCVNTTDNTCGWFWLTGSFVRNRIFRQLLSNKILPTADDMNRVSKDGNAWQWLVANSGLDVFDDLLEHEIWPTVDALNARNARLQNQNIWDLLPATVDGDRIRTTLLVKLTANLESFHEKFALLIRAKDTAFLNSLCTSNPDEFVYELMRDHRANHLECDLNDNELQHKLGLEYYHSKVVKSDTIAETCFQIAAAHGFTNAEVSLGALWVHQNSAKAFELLQLAAAKGHVTGQEYLAGMYEMGWGIPTDHGMAAYWYRKAAAQNNKKAIAQLARYETDIICCYHKAMHNKDESRLMELLNENPLAFLTALQADDIIDLTTRRVYLKKLIAKEATYYNTYYLNTDYRIALVEYQCQCLVGQKLDDEVSELLLYLINSFPKEHKRAQFLLQQLEFTEGRLTTIIDANSVKKMQRRDEKRRWRTFAMFQEKTVIGEERELLVINGSEEKPEEPTPSMM